MTTHLFGLTSDSPEDAAPKRSSRKKAKQPEAPVVVEAPVIDRPRAIRPIGQIDGEPCDGRAFGMPCQCTVWDIFTEDRGEWLVGCFVCGDVKWMPVVPGHLPESSTFVVHGGRFNGLTFDQIAKEPRGIDTIKVYASGHKNPAVQREARKWLDYHASHQ